MHHRIVHLLGFLSMLLGMANAHAQNQSSIEPIGIKMGALTAHPEITYSKTYDDNIFREQDNAQSDYISIIKPAITIDSDWGLHRLKTFANATIRRFIDNHDENSEDFEIGIDARYDIAHATYMDAGLSYEQRHEARDSPDDADGDAPTQFSITKGEIGFTRALTKLQLFTKGVIEDFDFDDGQSGGVVIDNDFRNRKHISGDIKLAFEANPNFTGFTRLIVDRRLYDTSIKSLDRSSQGMQAHIGAEFDITGKVKGSVYTGYIRRDYENAFKGINTPDFGAHLRWDINGLTTLSAAITRDVYETTRSSASGYLRTQGSLDLSHDFTRFISAAIGGYYAHDDFIGISREDDLWGIRSSVFYKPFRGGKAGLEYAYRNRDSSLTDQDFNNHRVMLTVGYSF